MNMGLIDTLVSQWRTIWKAFGDAGPLANALQIVGFVIPIVGGVRWYISTDVFGTRTGKSLTSMTISRTETENSTTCGPR